MTRPERGGGDGRAQSDEARQVLDKRMWERRNGKSRVTRDTLTVAEFVKKWQEDYLTVQQQLGRLKPSTIISYQCNLAGHIAPFFGAMSLGDVTSPRSRSSSRRYSARACRPRRSQRDRDPEGECSSTRSSGDILIPKPGAVTSSDRGVRTRRWTSSPRRRSAG